MSKHRVYDIAKELNTDNRTILDILRKNNVEVKSHSSTVDDAARQLVVKELKGNSQPGGKPQPQAAVKQPPQSLNRQKQVQPQAQGQQSKPQQQSKQQGQQKPQAQQKQNGGQQKQGQAKHGGSQPDARKQRNDGQKQVHQQDLEEQVCLEPLPVRWIFSEGLEIVDSILPL